MKIAPFMRKIEMKPWVSSKAVKPLYARRSRRPSKRVRFPTVSRNLHQHQQRTPQLYQDVQHAPSSGACFLQSPHIHASTSFTSIFISFAPLTYFLPTLAARCERAFFFAWPDARREEPWECRENGDRKFRRSGND